MSTQEKRLTHLETSNRNHETMLNLLTSIGERQQDLLEQVQRDAQQNQRMWVRVAKRYGWLEDEDLAP